ncbi:unnamed protein product [Parnassius mnemosyne]|uniref:RNA-directed DNA polymerase n=1 Tax=Parnassius mnemosyne TaxID=213953 RepID=A0AAV1KR97_9NEOP
MSIHLDDDKLVVYRLVYRSVIKEKEEISLAYIDDIIILSQTTDQGIIKLHSVLKLLDNAGLTLKLSKCVFFSLSVDYLGFEVSSEGIFPGARKIKAVELFPVPTNRHNVKQFLGLASFFQRFVQGFSVISKPLTKLLKKKATWEWGQEQQNAFNTLKGALVKTYSGSV